MIPDSNITVYYDAFLGACTKGHLQIAQWLFTSKPNIDISFVHERAFIRACASGYLQIAQWLYNLRLEMDNPIDISIDDEIAFRASCARGISS